MQRDPVVFCRFCDFVRIPRHVVAGADLDRLSSLGEASLCIQ